MKAIPLREGRRCAPEEATHLQIHLPGPSGCLILPVQIKGRREGTGNWTWNGSVDAPDLKPSILTSGNRMLTDEECARIAAGEKIAPRPFRCHSWLNDGMVQFLDDCSHEFRGQTLPLLDLLE